MNPDNHLSIPERIFWTIFLSVVAGAILFGINQIHEFNFVLVTGVLFIVMAAANILRYWAVKLVLEDARRLG